MKSINALSVCTILLMVTVTLAFGQESNYLHNRQVMERAMVAAAGGTAAPLGNMSASPAATVGDVYLTKDYRITTFWMYDDNKMVQGYASRLDMQRNEFDVHLGPGKGVRALPGTRVKTLMWVDSLTKTPQYFVNGQEYVNEEGTPYIGFFQILSEGELTLLKMTRVAFKPADHNPTHNTGVKDNRFLKSVELYYAQGKKAIELPGRKGILKLMESHKQEVSKFVDVNEINLTNERHLLALFDYYNSLVKK